jgi:hypothetical protein
MKPEPETDVGGFSFLGGLVEEVVQFSVFFRCDLESSANNSLCHSVHFVQGNVLARVQ